MSCPDSDTSNAAIVSAVAGPRRVQTDGMEVEQHPLPDLIEADRYLAAKCAARSKRQGVRFTQLVPGGTVNLP